MTSLASSPDMAMASALPSAVLHVEDFVPNITAQDLWHSAVDPVRQDLQAVEDALKTSLTSKVAGVPEMMAYLIQAGGKRVRPLVTCLVARACGYEAADHIHLACVSELLHTATLYHDDVVDNAVLRRGQETANHLFGNKVIVLAGDLMLAHCYALLMEGGYFQISRALSQTVKQMVEGEILQLQCEGDFDTPIEQYLEIIQNKTASLFSWCAKAGSMIASAARREINAKFTRSLSQFGFHLGMAFQLVDDWMDYLGDQQTMGKSTLKDLREGKITLPLLIAIKHTPNLKAELKPFLSPSNDTPGRHPKDFSVLSKIMEAIGKPQVIKETQAMIEDEIDQAREPLSQLAPSIYKTALVSLLEYLSRRDR